MIIIIFQRICKARLGLRPFIWQIRTTRVAVAGEAITAKVEIINTVVAAAVVVAAAMKATRATILLRATTAVAAVIAEATALQTATRMKEQPTMPKIIALRR